MPLHRELRKRIVVSADDYGIRRTAEPILRLAREGKIDRVAVMANSVTRAEASALLSVEVNIDIHLELIQLMGRGDELESGMLRRGGAFLRALLSGKLRPHSVEAHWKAQLERFTGLFGRVPDGFNSHEHIHFFPLFFPAFLRLARQYRVKTIRFGTRGLLWRESRSIIGGILSTFRLMDRWLARRDGFRSSTWLVGLDWMGEYEKLLEHLPPEGTIEIVVHPEREREYAFIDGVIDRL